MKRVIISVVIGLIIIGAIFFFFFAINKDVTQSDLYTGGNSGALVPAPGNEGTQETTTNTGGESESQTQNQGFVVEITSSGFSPKTLEISQGDTVTWTNKGSASSQPASAIHPTHTVYPESGGCIGSKFDACRGLAQGESYSFTFNQKGTWGYHDHLSPSRTGTIVVK